MEIIATQDVTESVRHQNYPCQPLASPEVEQLRMENLWLRQQLHAIRKVRGKQNPVNTLLAACKN